MLTLTDLRSISTTRVDGPSPVTPVYTAHVHGHPVSTTRVDGCQKMHTSSRAVNSGSGNRPLLTEPIMQVMHVTNTEQFLKYRQAKIY